MILEGETRGATNAKVDTGVSISWRPRKKMFQATYVKYNIDGDLTGPLARGSIKKNIAQGSTISLFDTVPEVSRQKDLESRCTCTSAHILSPVSGLAYEKLMRPGDDNIAKQRISLRRPKQRHFPEIERHRGEMVVAV